MGCAPLRVVTSKGVRGAGHALTEGRERVVWQLAAAQRCLAKGSERATAVEREAMRACLAGDLPWATGSDEKRVASAGRRLGEAVRRMQHGAAWLREAWREAGKTEMARRNTREGGREGARWRGDGLLGPLR